MFEDKTYEKLMQEKLDGISAQIDKREGSLIHFACGANSAETAQMYITLEWMLKQMFGDTAEREYLKKIAYDTRGLKPYPATYAVLKGKFDREIPGATRFSLDNLNYCISDYIGNDDGFYWYKVKCETLGEAGNRNFGTMVPIDFVKGLTVCELTELLVPGEEEEETESFRQRWRNSFTSVAFGGNKADYKEKICKIEGVGGCKVERATNAAGERKGEYVRCTIIASDYSIPSDTLVDNVQNIIDPKKDGEGDGIAPIGHICTISPVNGVTVDMKSKFTFSSGYTFSDFEIDVKTIISDYFKELAKEWDASEKLVVRISAIESRILEVKDIIDIADTTLNGKGENLILSQNDIPQLGTVGELDA